VVDQLRSALMGATDDQHEDGHYPDEDYYPVRPTQPATAKPERTVRVSVILRVLAAVVVVAVVGWIAYDRYAASQRVDVSALAEQVKASLQDNLHGAAYRQYQLTVVKVQLIKSGEHTYDGMAEVKPRYMDSHLVSVKVTADGETMWWETEPGAFLWLSTGAA
jgi:hypothetical protein